ncbi:hypothetical protein NDU88_004340 [Pleurodeles waltl]|uniref:Uncharacterized protein n=1 Tax=Pleurodeles waltl TaxID=8319 RepID=A0AAV7MUM0_PLEWA|nr:hypothetical protein NDU88_004340 [Pleurodeles waltl]
MFLCVVWPPLLLHLLFRPSVGLSVVVPYVLREPVQALVTALALSGAAGVWGLALLVGLTGHLRCGLGCRSAQRSTREFESALGASPDVLRWFDLTPGPAGGCSLQQARSLLAVGRDLLRSAARVGAGSQQRRADTSVSVSDGLAGRRGPAGYVRLYRVLHLDIDNDIAWFEVMCATYSTMQADTDAELELLTAFG